MKDIFSDPNCANLSFQDCYVDDGVVAGLSLGVQKVLALIKEKGRSTSLSARYSPPLM